MKTLDLKKIIFDFMLVITGNFLLAIAVHTFILPYEILSGGVAGIAVSVSRLTGVRSDLIITILIWVLFALGAFFLGKKFTVHTISSSILYPVFLNVLAANPISLLFGHLHPDCLLARQPLTRLYARFIGLPR